MTRYEQAKHLGWRCFYDERSNSIRSCPENYCLAERLNRKWRAHPDAIKVADIDAVRRALVEFSSGSTGGGLADIIRHHVHFVEPVVPSEPEPVTQ